MEIICGRNEKERSATPFLIKTHTNMIAVEVTLDMSELFLKTMMH